MASRIAEAAAPVEQDALPPPVPELAPVSKPPASFVSGRFGEVPDEIDTTPRDDAPRVVPNTASTPSWTLSDHAEIDTTPKEDAKPSEPPKKGWWQRAFKS